MTVDHKETGDIENGADNIDRGQATPVFDEEGRRLVISSTSYTGAYPPPEIIHAFEQYHTGSAGEILAIVKSEQKHRHKTDWGALGQGYLNTILSFAAMVLLLAFAVFLVHQDAPKVAAVMASAGPVLAGLAKVVQAWKAPNEKLGDEKERGAR